MSEIKFVELNCQRCGGALEQNGDTYTCQNCGKKWQMETLHDFTDMLEACDQALQAQRIADIANLRQLLWKEIGKEYISNKEVERLCKKIQEHLPQDFYANFFLATCAKNKSALGDFLDNADADEHYDDIPLVLDYTLKALKPEWVMGVSNFIEKIKDVDISLYGKYRTLFEQEYEKIEECTFVPDFPRDVFIAYSSKDMAEVSKLVTALEEENLTCFVAARNMRHGSGSVDSYNDIIHTAINNCQVLVFVSSDNSRSARCDAYKELSFIKEYRGTMPRVELIIKNYSGKAAERFFKTFFEGHEYCISVADVVERVTQLLMSAYEAESEPAQDGLEQEKRELQRQIEEERRKARQLELQIAQARQSGAENTAASNSDGITEASFTSGKICVKCKKSNKTSAKYCTYCGGNEFFITYNEYLASKQKYCAVCGAPNTEDAVFCTECGSNSFVFTKKEREVVLAKIAEQERQRKLREEEERKRYEIEAKSTLLKLGIYGDIDGGYITFGTYPQTKKSDKVKIWEILDKEQGNYQGYYLGSDKCIYAEFMGEYYKVEPIKWKVLSRENGLFLMSDEILDVHRFDGVFNNYANSEIRKWLNGEFYYKAFAENQRNVILTTTVDNSLASTGDQFNKCICDNTTDSIFLLSHKEAEQYLIIEDNSGVTKHESLKRVPTDYAIAKGVRQSTSSERDGKWCGWWWLRSPQYHSQSYSKGIHGGGAFDYSDVSRGDNGVVPAIKIKV